MPARIITHNSSLSITSANDLVWRANFRYLCFWNVFNYAFPVITMTWVQIFLTTSFHCAFLINFLRFLSFWTECTVRLQFRAKAGNICLNLPREVKFWIDWTLLYFRRTLLEFFKFIVILKGIILYALSMPLINSLSHLHTLFLVLFEYLTVE